MMEDLRPLPIVVLGLGIFLIWGGLTGESPVQRIKNVLTRGGVQNAPQEVQASTTGTLPTGQTTYTVRSDYLA